MVFIISCLLIINLFYVTPPTFCNQSVSQKKFLRFERLAYELLSRPGLDAEALKGIFRYDCDWLKLPLKRDLLAPGSASSSNGIRLRDYAARSYFLPLAFFFFLAFLAGCLRYIYSAE